MSQNSFQSTGDRSSDLDLQLILPEPNPSTVLSEGRRRYLRKYSCEGDCQDATAFSPDGLERRRLKHLQRSPTMVPTTPLRVTQYGTIIAATPAHEREEDQRLIGEILDNMNCHISANGANPAVTEAAGPATADQGTAHWNVTVKALVQMAILDMLAKWGTHLKDLDPEKKALNLSLNLVDSVLRTLRKKFEADGRLLFSGTEEAEGGVASQGTGDDIPLYRWLLPRLCFAASEFAAKPALKRFASDTMDLAAYLVDAVGQYLDTQASEGAMGMYLGRSLVSGLTVSCTGEQWLITGEAD